MRPQVLITALMSGAFLSLHAFADSGDATELRRHNPVIYSPTQESPFDLYPKEIIGNVIRRDRNAYTICNERSCTLIRNFGHDATIQRDYIEHLIQERRAQQ